VHTLKSGEAQERVTLKCLQPAGGIRTIISKECLTQTIRESGGEAPRPGIAPARADSRNQRGRFVACPGQFQQALHILRAVLPVSVHRYDPGRARRHDPGDQGRCLAATPVMAQQTDGIARSPQRPNAISRYIRAAVIDIDELELS